MRALIGYVKTNPHDHVEYLARIEDVTSIAVAAGYEPVGVVVQTLLKENPSLVFGKGKVEEISDMVWKTGAEAFIVYNILSSIQQLNLERRLGIKVIDRYDLTLEIFEKHASDKASKLQIELARTLKRFPYEKLRASIKYFGERPGPHSAGEYAYHRVVGQLRRRIKMLEEAIEEERVKRTQQLLRRRRLGYPILVLSGYYNAGKTSLFNALTNLRKPVSDAPFTTLSSKYYLARRAGRRFFVVDTIGFAMGLDPRVIHSFRLTLDDIVFSDVVILTLDGSDSARLFNLRLRSSLQILEELGVGEDRIVVAINKVDMIGDDELAERVSIVESQFEHPPPVVPVSALKRFNLGLLVLEALNVADSHLKEAFAPPP